MIFLAQAQAPQLPPLPEGPSLDRLRDSIEISSGNETWQIILLILAAVIILALIAWRFFRKATPSSIPPEQVAYEQITAASQLSNDDDSGFAVLCSDALRRFFEQGLGLSSQARTSEEFLHSLKENTQFDINFQNTLAELLLQFDRIKFGREQLTSDERIQVVDTSKRLIEETKGGDL